MSTFGRLFYVTFSTTMVTGVTSATRVVEMKDGEKALLALAAVGGYLYWAKVNPSGGISSRTPQIPSGPAVPLGATRFYLQVGEGEAAKTDDESR